MQAVVKIGSSQYLVTPGQELLVDRDAVDAVLMVIDDKKIQIGNPIVKDVTVKLKVLGEAKGPKVRIAKYKAKSRYRKTTGFRPQFLKVLVESIKSRETKA
jgi:large subunit ribosomal protein L21